MNSYRREMERLLNLPDESFRSHVHRSWTTPSEWGYLFGFCNKERKPDGQCGCLTMVHKPLGPYKCDNWYAQTEELTEAIKADDRIPDRVEDITKENLYVFVEWQERLDEELGRDLSVIK